MLSRIAEEGFPCYLETFDGANVPFYRGYGFEPVHHCSIPELGIELHCMAKRP